MAFRFLVYAMVVVAYCGCSTAEVSSIVSKQSFHAANYYPLKVGAAWVYEVEIDGTEGPANMHVLVSGLSDDKNSQRLKYILSILDESLPAESRLDEPVIYEVRTEEGIYCVKCGAFLLKNPIQVGNEWAAGQHEKSARYSITSIGVAVNVNGKRIHDYLVVDLTDPIQDRRIEYVYAPNVGPVLVRYFRLDSDPGERKPYRVEKLAEFGNTSPPRFLRRPAQ